MSGEPREGGNSAELAHPMLTVVTFENLLFCTGLGRPLEGDPLIIHGAVLHLADGILLLTRSPSTVFGIIIIVSIHTLLAISLVPVCGDMVC